MAPIPPKKLSRPPHAATVVQSKRPFGAAAQRSPHPATTGVLVPPHPAKALLGSPRPPTPIAERARQESNAPVKRGRPGVGALQMASQWRTDHLDELFVALRANLAEVFDTGHHKLPKSLMEDIYDAMTSTQLKDARSALGLAPDAGRRAFKSLGSNLTVGPHSGVRIGDPNRGFDANVIPPDLDGDDGGSSPRSVLYEQLFEFMTKRKERTKAPFSEEEFKFVLTHLQGAEKIHYLKTLGKTLDPDVSMWIEITSANIDSLELPQGIEATARERLKSVASVWWKGPSRSYVVDYSDARSITQLNKDRRPHRQRTTDFVVKSFPELVRFAVDENTQPLGEEALDRWKDDGYVRYFNRELREWWFIREAAVPKYKRQFLRKLVLCNKPDNKDFERILYGFYLLRPFG